MTIKKVFVHCSATPPSMNIGADTIRKWHVEGNGWLDIGYNYVIKRDGTLEHGRDLDGDGDVEDEIGSHAYGHNKGSLGICLIGGIDKNGKTEANFTAAQYRCLIALKESIDGRHNSPEWCGHNEVSEKDCPSFNVKEFFRVL